MSLFSTQTKLPSLPICSAAVGITTAFSSVATSMLVATEENAVVIPTAALQMGNEGNFVWVLNSDNKVSKHLVKTGIQDSQTVVISALSLFSTQTKLPSLPICSAAVGITTAFSSVATSMRAFTN